MLRRCFIRTIRFYNIAATGLAFVMLAALLALPCPAPAQGGAIVITSERFSTHRHSGAALFEGDVVVRNGDMILSAQSMTAWYGQSGGVSNIVAEGKVKLVKGLQVLTSERAVYEMPKGRMIFTGEPRAVDSGRVLVGQSIEYFPDEEKIKVSQSSVLIEGSGGDNE